MRVQLVDPPAYTPPYDRSLAAALARAGADVELVTSAFAWGSVPAPDGYTVREDFYSRSTKLPPDSRRRRLVKAMEHPGDMRGYRATAADADVVHFQWLTFPGLDARLLPSDRPLVQTPHGLLRAEAWDDRRAGAWRRLLGRMDAVVALSGYGAEVLRSKAGVPTERVHVIPHGPLDYLARMPDEAPLPPDLAAVDGPVVLFFGLIRPYKGVDVLLEAFREVEGAELWVVGRPFGVDFQELAELAGQARATVRLIPRFVDDREVAAYFRRADLVALPHRDAEQSGALFTALAFGKAVVMSDVGGFGEVSALGAGRLVDPGDPAALAAAIGELLDDADARAELEAGARAAAEGPYAWDQIAAQTIALYEDLRRE
jgi:glycosyltransferase involved in cell wall biosynthesis